MRIRTPEAVRWICRTLEAAGYETWAVGGAVRDALAGAPSGDWDLTTRARPDDVRNIFPRTVPLGIEHGTVGVLARTGGGEVMYEVTTFRRDVETTGRHAVVTFADRLDEDLARRDFTINAVAWHPLRDELHDPFGGAADMEARILRTVGDPEARFAEDYLRVLRALRFAGRFELRIDGPTWRALCDAVPRMGILSAERVRDELDKVLVGGGRASAALALQAASGVTAFLHPALDKERARKAWPRALRTVDLLPKDDADLRLAAFLSATGGTVSAIAILMKLRASNRRIREVGTLAGALAEVADSPGASFLVRDPQSRRRWMEVLGRDLTARALPLIIAHARAAGPDREKAPSEFDTIAALVRAVRSDLHARHPLTEAELELTGRDLIGAGYRPGPAFGHVLELLLDEVHGDPSLNRTDRLLARAKELMEESENESEEDDE